jgi:hypothetical protein
MPAYGHALMEALCFSAEGCKGFKGLRDEDWKKLLPLCDASQLTLLIGHLGHGYLPGWVSERIHRNYLSNCRRLERLQSATTDIAGSLRKHSIDSVVLKGFAHWIHFISDPVLRSQGDIDIWCRPDQVYAAKDVLTGLGYRSVGQSKGRHLDPMIRETAWAWTGDYFATDLPIPVDLHFQLWDSKMERIAGPCEEEIWQRRCNWTLAEGIAVGQLDLADAVSFAALHVLMHLLHGDVRLQRTWELGFFLRKHSGDDAFWQRWRNLYSDQVRQMQVISFVLSNQWFDCGLPTCVREEEQSLPEDIRLWLRQYGSSPIQSLFTTNKDELWLNLCLLRSFSDKARLIVRRLFPVSAREIGFAASHVNNGSKNKISTVARLVLRRAIHHLIALPLTCLGGLAWWWRCQRMSTIWRRRCS